MNQLEAFRIIFLITTPKLADKAEKILLQENLPVNFSLNATGTASSEMLDILGLGTPERTILLSILPKSQANSVLRKLQNALVFSIPGNGLACTMPLSGATKLILKLFEDSLAQRNTLVAERKEETNMTDKKRVMIAAVVNQGFTEEVMNAARSAGAGGGSVVHARHVGDKYKSDVLSLGVQEEKEIVLIVADSENKLDIMKAIGEKCGMQSDAKGMVVSLPIDTVVGLGEEI